MHIIGYDDFLGQVFFPTAVMHWSDANPFFLAFKYSARPFHVYFSFKLRVRFHALKNVVCLTESIHVIKMLWFTLFQMRKKFVETNLC